METATYLIGPSDFFTSGDLEADAKTVNSQIAALDTAIEGNEAIPTSFQDGWGLWVMQWRAFYADKFEGFFDFLVALNNSNRDALISFERQLADWLAQAAALGARPAGPTIAPSQGTQDTLAAHLKKQSPSLGLPDVSTIVVVLVVVIVGLFAWRHFA